MAVENYGMIKGIPVDSRMERDLDKPHYQIHMIGEKNVHYRIAVNVMSSSEKSEVLYLVDEHFDASAITILPTMKHGYTKINESNREIALDYIRGNLFDPSEMKPLPHDVIGPDNDLNELLDKYIQIAINEKATMYVYGSKFGLDNGEDWVFGFTPPNGMHNVHMNQGNEKNGSWANDNGIWHDGGILIEYENRWVAIFLAFQSQSWCTDDSGHPTAECDHNEVSIP